MARGNNQKLKMLYLARIMQTETDDAHGLTMPQIIEKPVAYEIDAHKKPLRRELWSRGLRYRKNVTRSVGKSDVAFLGKKVAVFCDSEF
ncbi:MAG: hypothetical protein ACI4GW_12325 [Lachnospiraceae bacterium]